MNTLTPKQKKEYLDFLEKVQTKSLDIDKNIFYIHHDNYTQISEGGIEPKDQTVYTVWVNKKTKPTWEYYLWGAIKNYIQDLQNERKDK